MLYAPVHLSGVLENKVIKLHDFLEQSTREQNRVTVFFMQNLSGEVASLLTAVVLIASRLLCVFRLRLKKPSQTPAANSFFFFFLFFFFYIQKSNSQQIKCAQTAQHGGELK